MLNSPPLKQTDTARAEKISGVAIARTYPMPSADPSEASKIDAYTSIGFSPYATIRSEPSEQGDPERGEQREELAGEALQPRGPGAGGR